jgi:hypothetical protein
MYTYTDIYSTHIELRGMQIPDHGLFRSGIPTLFPLVVAIKRRGHVSTLGLEQAVMPSFADIAS